MSTFAALGLDPILAKTIEKLGYQNPTPIQEQAIPVLLQAKDMIGQAATGTGKTAAFSLPMLHRFASTPAQKRKGPRGLVLTPTRELALQVAEAIESYGKNLGLKALAVYGGQAFLPQVQGIKRGVDVVVATPGRALDHIRNKTLDLSSLEVLVLDEADEMLDMGFVEDIDSIIAKTPESRQTVMFSATLPGRVAAIAKRHLKEPVKIQVTAKPIAQGQAPAVQQFAYIIPRSQKIAVLNLLLETDKPGSALIFCRTRQDVDNLVRNLSSQGQKVEPLHGGMSQAQRDSVMKRLRSEQVDLVIATDVAARGLDIDHLTHVINFDLPGAPEAYVHRIGRVGRAGREGVAISFLEPRDRRLLRNLEAATGHPIALGRLPTPADVEKSRQEQSKKKLEKVLEAGGYNTLAGVIEELSADYDLKDLAMAALRLALGPDKPVLTLAPESDRKSHTQDPFVCLQLNMGHKAGIRPKDLVGAITGELQVNSRAIGHIDIRAEESTFEVRESLVAAVLKALNNTTIKGQKVQVERSATEIQRPQSRQGGFSKPKPSHRHNDSRGFAGKRSQQKSGPQGGGTKPSSHPRRHKKSQGKFKGSKNIEA